MPVVGKEVKDLSSSDSEKGKAPVKVELTEADLLAADKKRRVEENDARKRKTILTRERLRKEMEQEMKNTQVNKLKVQQQWRNIMRMDKVESLRKEIEILSQSLERDIDRRDAIVETLKKDLDDAEEQYQVALRSHLSNIDKLIQQQDMRLKALESEFQAELADISNEFNEEREQINRQHDAEKQELLDIISAVEAEEQAREAEEKQEHEQAREEIRNKNLEDVNILRITLESTIEELERCFETAHLNYLQNTDQRTQDFKFLTKKDNDLSRELEQKMKKIEKLQESLANWRAKINQNAAECEERNGSLRVEKEQIAQHFSDLKAKMNSFREVQASKLMELTRTTVAARRNIKEKLDVAERIVKLAEIARKYETEEEKIRPFHINRIHDKEAGSENPGCISEIEKFSAQQQQNMKSRDTFQTLEPFFKRFNKVMLSKLAVEKERERLRKENEMLKSVAKQFKEGTNVNDDILERNNALLVVNGKVNISKKSKARSPRKGPPPVVDLRFAFAATQRACN